MRCAHAEPAEVHGSRDALNLAVRTAWEVPIPDAADVSTRVTALRSELSDHFGGPLGDLEEPTFLLYRAGGFYRPHRDRASRTDDAAGTARARRVSIVVFLNAGYTGGALTLYGLIDDPVWRDYGFAVPATTGLLVAFPSDLLHEVTPVTAGERYTAVSWFHA